MEEVAAVVVVEMVVVAVVAVVVVEMEVERLSNSVAAPAEQEDTGRKEDVIDRLYPSVV